MPDSTKPDELQRVIPDEPTGTQRTDASALARLLDEWMHGDEAEQKETFQISSRSLDEDRPDGYKLFS